MALITINDLPLNRALDRKAMSSIRGAGAEWVYGWIRPFVPTLPALSSAGLGSVVNVFQTNNIFVAGQMNNQFQIIDVNNSAPNTSIDLHPAQVAINSQNSQIS